MANAKPSFRDALRARIRERAAARGSKVEFAGTEDELVEFVYGIARDSFVNGLAAGKAKSAPRVGASRRAAARQKVN